MENKQISLILVITSILVSATAIVMLLSKKLGSGYITMYLMSGSDGDLVAGLIFVILMLNAVAAISIYTNDPKLKLS